jgi:putative intracellular protease/amidase
LHVQPRRQGEWDEDPHGSHIDIGGAHRRTGFRLEDLAAPYCLLRDAGIDVALASPKGGQPPLDPKTLDPKCSEPAFQTDAFSATADWGVNVVQDGLLITRQNPASSKRAARTLLDALRTKQAP